MVNLKGTIFKIEKLAIYDGPGIRTVIFLKGCPLRCKWCSSPESQIISPEMGYSVDKCFKCGKCVKVCPEDAIRISEKGDILTNWQLCNNCGECVEGCAFGARKMIGRQVTANEVVREIEKDEIFYHHSGGGVTLSGGEPAMQPEFSFEILKACRHRGLHTAMETCGFSKWNVLSEMLKYLDLIYIDIKHMSSEKHLELTGQANMLILENIKNIDVRNGDTSLIIRIPVIPGISDTPKNIENTAAFIRGLNRVERIELLPYHKYGVGTYSIIGREYPLMNLRIPSQDHLNSLREAINSFNIPVRIGG